VISHVGFTVNNVEEHVGKWKAAGVPVLPGNNAGPDSNTDGYMRSGPGPGSRLFASLAGYSFGNPSPPCKSCASGLSS
jgi:hypothetical protein